MQTQNMPTRINRSSGSPIEEFHGATQEGGYIQIAPNQAFALVRELRNAQSTLASSTRYLNKLNDEVNAFVARCEKTVSGIEDTIGNVELRIGSTIQAIEGWQQ